MNAPRVENFSPFVYEALKDVQATLEEWAMEQMQRENLCERRQL